MRYQIKHGAQLIKVCCSGGVMPLTGEAGAQHYSDEELRAIVDEAHRRGLRVAAHTHGAEAVKHAVECGIDCIEHGFLMDDEAIKMLVDNDRFLVTTRRLAEAMDVSRAPKELQDKAAETFPKARIAQQLKGTHPKGGSGAAGPRLGAAPRHPLTQLPRTPRALATLDAALRSGRCSRAEMWRAAVEQVGRRGIVAVRELLPLADERAESPMESEARLAMIDGGLPIPSCSTRSSTATVSCGAWTSRGRSLGSRWSTTGSTGTATRMHCATTAVVGWHCRTSGGS